MYINQNNYIYTNKGILQLKNAPEQGFLLNRDKQFIPYTKLSRVEEKSISIISNIDNVNLHPTNFLYFFNQTPETEKTALKDAKVLDYLLSPVFEFDPLSADKKLPIISHKFENTFLYLQGALFMQGLISIKDDQIYIQRSELRAKTITTLIQFLLNTKLADSKIETKKNYKSKNCFVLKLTRLGVEVVVDYFMQLNPKIFNLNLEKRRLFLSGVLDIMNYHESKSVISLRTRADHIAAEYKQIQILFNSIGVKFYHVPNLEGLDFRLKETHLRKFKHHFITTIKSYNNYNLFKDKAFFEFYYTMDERIVDAYGYDFHNYLPIYLNSIKEGPVDVFHELDITEPILTNNIILS